MLNEWTYCNRLGVLMWVHQEFEHSADTVDGVWKHRRADTPTRDLPASEELATLDDGDVTARRSLWLSSDAEGLTAKMDVVEVRARLADEAVPCGPAGAGQGGLEVVPVDTKRGSPPDTPDRSWEPERVQLCAQGLVLRDHGYACSRGFLYFAEAKERVEVVFDEALVARTRELLAGFRDAAASGVLPAPLEDSPKCPRCSLVGICLPDETRLLAQGPTPDRGSGRQLLAPLRPSSPLFVTGQGARVGVRAGRFVVTERDGGRVADVRVRDTSVVGLHGMVQMSTQALRAAMEAEVPVCYFTYGGWFIGHATGHPHKNVQLRQAQFAAAQDPERSLTLAREVVRSKVRNQRTLLRRNHPDVSAASLAELSRLAGRARGAVDVGVLLGLEGAAARLYFQHFNGLLKAPVPFDFDHRNRRPPRDPVNALLSYAYSLLVREIMVATLAVGFDPYLGFFHTPRYGRPALALDLMEEVRPLIADSAVISALNNGELGPSSFYIRADGCQLTKAGRAAFIRAFYRRLEQEITHPIFGYRATWRRVLEIQARLLGRHLLGEIPAYTPIETR